MNFFNPKGPFPSPMRPPLSTSVSNDKINNNGIQVMSDSTPALQTRLYRSSSATPIPLSSGCRANAVISSSLSKTQAKRSKSTKEKESIQLWMARTAARLSSKSRRKLKKQCRRHGRRIAQNPVQTLMLISLIVTSLFYPAVGVYVWSSRGGPSVIRGDANFSWRSLSTPFLDSFASSGRKHHNSVRDLRMIWDEAPDLRAIDARDSKIYSIGNSISSWHSSSQYGMHEEMKTSTCTSFRMEHVFITTDDVTMGLGHIYGSLHMPILRSALNLQRSIEVFLESGKGRSMGLPSCIRDASTSKCLVLSPLSYWLSDKDLISTDTAPTTTILRSTLNYTEQGVPITLSTSLAGRNRLFQQHPRADHLVLTFFLEDKESSNRSHSKNSKSQHASTAHLAWSSMLRNITGRQVSLLNSDLRTPKEIILQFIPGHREESFRTMKVLLTVIYVALLVWLTRSLFSIRNVHSPLGLAFTKCVELVISMALAFSICTLSGIRLTLIPYEILPFVIVVIGSENMLALTNAVVSTPTSLSVGARLAAGFEKAGMSIAVTVLTDALLMATISIAVNVRAVSEFCIFVILALMVDFFLQFYIYATALSIDIQRSDLANFPSQDKSDGQKAIKALNDDTESVHHVSASVDEARLGSLRASEGTSFSKISCSAACRATTARTLSLSLLLAFVAGIYLYTSPGYTSSFSDASAVQEKGRASCSHVPSDLTASPLHGVVADGVHAFDSLSRPHAGEDRTINPKNPPSPWWHSSPSARLWQTLNPANSASLHVKVEPWTIVSLPSASRQHINRMHFASWAIFRPRIRAFIWFFKLIILPIAGTIGLLWVLLLYLFKNTELLNAKKSKCGEQDDLEEETDSQVQGERAEAKVHLVTTLSVCAEGHGFDITLVCYAGVHIISIAADSTLQVARASRKRSNLENLVLLKDILHAYHPVSALAADLASDLIMIGHTNGQVTLFSISSLRLIRTSLTDQPTEEQPLSRISHISLLPNRQPSSPLEFVSILSFHSDGSAWRWTMDGPPSKAIESNVTQTAWAAFGVSRGALPAKDLALFFSSDGSFRLFKLMEEAPFAKPIMTATSVAGIAKCATLISILTDSSRTSKLYLSVGTMLGKLVLFETDTGRLLAQIDLCGSPIDKIQSIHGDTSRLSENSLDGFDGILLTAVTSSSVVLFSLEGILSTTSVAGSHKAPPTVAKWSQSSDQGSNDASLGPPASPNKSTRALRRNICSRLLAPDMVENSHVRRSMWQSNESMHSSNPISSTFLSGTNISGFNIFAEFGCRRGGADVVLTANGASLVGVRRLTLGYAGMRDARGSGANRWELFEVDLPALWNSKHGNLHNLLSESDCERFVQKAPLLIEEDASTARIKNFHEGGAISTGRDRRQSTNMSKGAGSMPTTLSFTRLSHVCAYYKNDHSPPASTAKIPILFAFGNALGIAYVSPDESGPKNVKTKVGYPFKRKGQ